MARRMSAQVERRPEGKEGAGAHQEGRGAEHAGQTNRRSPAREQQRDDDPNAGRQGGNDHQKTVQGKNQHGPDDKAGRDVGGGNAGSKGQNVDQRRNQGEHTGKKSGT